MNASLLALICFSLTIIPLSLVWAVDFSRYNQILERRPFAPVISTEDEAPKDMVTVVKPPAFVKDLRMCAITESPAGLKVGFVNIRKKPPRPYYLYVGDAEDGIKLVDADYKKSGALLRKGKEQFWMYMGGASPAGTASPKTKNPTARMPTGRMPIAMRRGKGGAALGTPISSSSYAERRQKRLEEMRARAAKARQLSDKQVEEKLQKYQMDLIRKGLTPLPMKLTPEMDRQLVKEGVLPPLE